MRFDGDLEVHHPVCPVCGALPGTTCVQDGQKRDQVHPSRRLSIAERNRRSVRGWIPPELAARR
jgi:hypothetical protein